MKRLVYLCTVSAILILTSTLCTGEDNALSNAGFEKAKGQSVENWEVPKHWSGTLVSDNTTSRSGKACGKLTAEEKGNKHWGRIWQSLKFSVFSGRKIRYSMWAKGKGEFLLGAVQYKPRIKDEKTYTYLWSEQVVTLTDKWQKVVYEFSVTNPNVNHLIAIAEIRGEGAEVFIDDASFAYFHKTDTKLSLTPALTMAFPGGTSEVAFALTENDKAITNSTIEVILMHVSGISIRSSVSTDTAGKAKLSVAIPKDSQPCSWRVVAFSTDTGASAEAFCDITAEDEFVKMDATAKKIKLPAPLRILYIGDSLSDQQRGHNYTDKINFWLNRYNPGHATFNNAGVVGDHITRIWDRIRSIDGEKPVYRQDMYDKLLEPKPDIVFIFLGHNDTKASRKNDYKIPLVPTAVQEDTYKKVIAYIQKHCDARIVLLTASSSVYEICRANADKKIKLDKTAYCFGVPARMEEFNAVIEKLCHELKLDCVDVYKPTKNHPDKPSLFSPRDGVHLSKKGNQFIALQILKYLAENPPANIERKQQMGDVKLTGTTL
ncbi:MAG: carbohydrate binding domain-containing protein [Pirellulales bacterium]|nr:carbohydrate binding domain-containing protein [Pirellulales bacterium]